MNTGIQGFKEYLLLEKIEKREFNRVFADDTIRIGIEFECYLDGLSGDGALPSDAEGEYDKYIDDVDEYIKNSKENIADWEDEMQSNIQVALDARNTKLDVLERELFKIDDQNSTEYESLQYEIDDLEDEISEIGGLQTYDLEDNEFDIDYYPSNEAIDNEGYPPQIPDTVIEYLDIVGEVDTDNIQTEATTVIYSIIFDEDSRTFRDIMRTDLDVDVYTIESSETYIDDLENYDWSNFPFDNYVIGGYHDNGDNFHQWRIETDSSTGENGVEIISPIMKLQDALPVMKKMFAFINKYGGTTKDHGMHVNISKKGAGTETVDLLKLMMFVDEGYVWKNFPDRIGNRYAKSVLDDIASQVRLNSRSIDSDLKKTAENIQNAATLIFPAFKSKLDLPKEKFKGVNYSHLYSGSGRIEMRYLGGKDYHKKYKENVSAIGRYVYYLLLSLDPEFKKREYALKLLRLSDKFNEKNVSKISKREFSNVYKNGTQIGFVSGGKGNSSYIEYHKLGKFVYEISDNEIRNIYSLKTWMKIKSNINGFELVS